MMRKVPIWLAALVLGGSVLAQSSASYNLEEHVFNSGGHPLGGTTLASASFKISLDSLGEAISATDLTSASYRLDACFSAAYPPPGEVNGLLTCDGRIEKLDRAFLRQVQLAVVF